MIDRIGSLFADADSLASLGTDVAVKATLICLSALAADWLFRRRVLVRSAVWHASLLALALLPLAAVCFPHWRVACLPDLAAPGCAKCRFEIGWRKMSSLLQSASGSPFRMWAARRFVNQALSMESLSRSNRTTMSNRGVARLPAPFSARAG